MAGIERRGQQLGSIRVDEDAAPVARPARAPRKTATRKATKTTAKKASAKKTVAKKAASQSTTTAEVTSDGDNDVS